MSDLIRGEDAMRSRGLGEVWEKLENIQPVDAVALRPGRWIIKSSGAYCSECEGEICISNAISNASSYEYCVSQIEKLIKKPLFKICPFCGAKMDMEDVENDKV